MSFLCSDFSKISKICLMSKNNKKYVHLQNFFRMILSIETATPTCSVALHQEGKLIASYELHTEKSHNEELTLLIQEICKQSKCPLTELSAVAVSKGPGSYTGLRIGVATAKGLCYALQKPLIAIGSLEAMVEQVVDFFPTSTLFCPMIDARRMEVYCLLMSSKKEILLPTSAIVVEKNTFEQHLSSHQIVFFGNGAEKCKKVISHPNAIFLENFYPLAKSMGKLAWEKFQRKEFENLFYFEPYYLKEFVTKTSK